MRGRYNWRANSFPAYHQTVIHSQESLQEWIFGAAIPLGAPIPGGLDEVMNQQLAYELPVAQTTELAGPVIANFSFSSNEIDSYVLARLCRVDTSGADHLLSLGAISPVRRRLDPARGSAIEIALDTDVRDPLVSASPSCCASARTDATRARRDAPPDHRQPQRPGGKQHRARPRAFPAAGAAVFVTQYAPLPFLRPR